MTSPFALMLERAPKAVTFRAPIVAGMSNALRHVLSAQAAGAVSVHIHGGELLRQLDDPRRTIPILLDPPPATLPRIELAEHVVVHRGVYRQLLDAIAGGATAVSIGKGESRIVAFNNGDSIDSSKVPTELVFDVPFGFQPIAIQTRADVSRATSALLRALRKTQDGWTSTYLNRYISLACTRVLLHTKIHPNQLSVAILLLGLSSGIVAARGNYQDLVVGAVLLKAQSVLDGCDGELSRLTFRGSRLGEWLDTIGDDLSNYGFFAGASWGLYRSTGSTIYLIAGAIIVACGFLTSGLEYRYLAKIGSGDLLKYPLGLDDAGGEPTTWAGKIAAAIRPLFKRDTFVFLTLLAAIAKLLGPMLIVFAVGAISIVSAVLKAEARMSRERRLAEARGETP